MDVVAQLIGYPRIGPNRELKRALERMWSGRLAADAFAERVDELRRAQVQGPCAGGLGLKTETVGPSRRGYEERPTWAFGSRSIGG